MRKYFFLLIIFLISFYVKSQNNLQDGKISGNFELNAQSYKKDSLIKAEIPPEKILMNSYANINYEKGNFKAGFRYEAYMNSLKAYDSRYDENGIPYRYVIYKINDLEITVGNYYEQFGNGLIFRTYEDKNLGYDNAMDGIRLKYNFNNRIYLKAIAGKQRFYFEKGKGILRGIDGEFLLNEIFDSLSMNTRFSVGGSFLSKYEKDENSSYHLPENVGAYSGRFSIIHSFNNGRFLNFNAEFSQKINDPNASNNLIYKNGEAILLNLSFSQKGMGLLFNVKRTDNMDFRSERNASITDLLINYIPNITKNHTYSLLAMYPYVTQTNGEIGFQTEIMYKFMKKTILGGKYGTDISVNFSQMNNIEKAKISDTIPLGKEGTDGYKSDFFKIGEELLFQDFSIEINKKLNRKIKFTLIYQNLIYNYDINRGTEGHKNVNANIGIFDISYKFKSRNSLRTEFQILLTEEDEKDWAMISMEYNLKKFFFILQDQYNYGNEIKKKQTHYYLLGAGYNYKTTRFEIRYGKQKEGITCAGGICRNVPATYGMSFMLTNSF
ncbi:MAG: hypothetical protein B6I24_06895 [Bacteroidetes bacterium 4572_128]|nr:MAG: hypothetical protein B6I24_06895 [Bacteroidetes bacterium 4572_128]